MSYRDSFRNEDQVRRNVGSPDTRFYDVERTVQEERTAGANTNGDVFEQPFDSLGLVYKWFPTDRIEVQLRLDNILDEKRRFEQISGSSGNQGDTVTVLEQEIGATFGVSARFFFRSPAEACRAGNRQGRSPGPLSSRTRRD